MGMTVLSTSDKADSVEVLFSCLDRRTENLANLYIRWLPIVPELRALERALRKIEPDLGIRWSPRLEKHWSRYDPSLAITSRGMVLTASPWMSLGVESCSSLQLLSFIPVVTLQIADNPRASWLMGSLLMNLGRLPHTASWSCRPHDLIAIALMIRRFEDVTVTARVTLMEETDREFQPVDPVPKSRLRK